MSIFTGTPRQTLGQAAESATCEHLIGIGYRILDKNWRKPWGEIDIVAQHGGVVHFIEVKASSSAVAGFEPYLRANTTKMHKVRRTAQTWLSDHRYPSDTEWQMDIASVIMNGDRPEIEIFENV